MVQEAKRDAEMEKVYGVFEEYIKSSPYIEWLWSEKLGYVLMQIAAKEREVVESRVVTDAGDLCRILLHEVAEDALRKRNSEHTPYEADALERDEIGKELKPYIDQLPEYRDCCKEWHGTWAEPLFPI